MLHKLAPPPPSRQVVKPRAQALPLHQFKPPASRNLLRTQVSLFLQTSEDAARPLWRTTTRLRRKSGTELKLEAGRSTLPKGRTSLSEPLSPQPHRPPPGPALPALQNRNPAQQFPTSDFSTQHLLNPLLLACSVPPGTRPTRVHLLTARSTKRLSLSCSPPLSLASGGSRVTPTSSHGQVINRFETISLSSSPTLRKDYQTKHHHRLPHHHLRPLLQAGRVPQPHLVTYRVNV